MKVTESALVFSKVIDSARVRVGQLTGGADFLGSGLFLLFTCSAFNAESGTFSLH